MMVLKWQDLRFPKVPNFWKFERILPVLQSLIGWAFIALKVKCLHFQGAQKQLQATIHVLIVALQLAYFLISICYCRSLIR